MKTCTECKNPKPESEFAFRSKLKGTLQPRCKPCHNAFIREHYAANKQYYIDKARVRNDRIREENQRNICEYLDQHPCVDCSEPDIVTLDFDHRDPECKTAEISIMLQNICSWQAIEAEIAKCDVRCKNCHARRTAKQFNYYRSRW